MILFTVLHWKNSGKRVHVALIVQRENRWRESIIAVRPIKARFITENFALAVHWNQRESVLKSHILKTNFITFKNYFWSWLMLTARLRLMTQITLLCKQDQTISQFAFSKILQILSLFFDRPPIIVKPLRWLNWIQNYFHLSNIKPRILRASCLSNASYRQCVRFKIMLKNRNLSKHHTSSRVRLLTGHNFRKSQK